MSLSVETIVLKIVLKSSRKILIAFWKICHSLRMYIYIYIRIYARYYSLIDNGRLVV